MSRLARNEYIKWEESHDEDELKEQFLKSEEFNIFFSEWKWEQFEDSLRRNV